MNRRHNNYNPYTYGYTAPIEGSSIVYQPVYDPTETERMTELLQQRQGRYDTARQNLSEFQGQVGGMDTYAPDMLNQKLEGFNSRVADLVKTQYGGDYGLAANDIVGMMAAEKKDPFYKLNAAQVKAADEERQFRMKNPDAFYTYKDRPSISSEDYLRQAYEAKNMAAFDEPTYGYAPDRQEIASKMIEGVPSDLYDRLLTGLSAEDTKTLESQLGPGFADAIFRSISTEDNKDKIKALRGNFVDMLLEKDKTFVKQYGEEEARKIAGDIIDKTMPMFYKHKEQESLINMGDEAREQAKARGTSQPFDPLTVEDPLQPKPTTQVTDETNDINVKNEEYIGRINQLKADKERNDKMLSDDRISEYTKLTFKKDNDRINKEISSIENSSGYKTHKAKLLKIKDDVADFEKNYINDDYKFPEGVTGEWQKAEFIASMEDAYRNQSSSLISTLNFNEKTDLSKDVQTLLVEAPNNLVEMRKWDTDTKEWKALDGKETPINFDLSNQAKNVNVKDFSFNGISPYDGRIRAVGKDNNGTVSGYPSKEAARFGKLMEESSKNLKDKEYSFDYSFGKPKLSIKVFDKDYPGTNSGNGAFTDEILDVPDKYIKRASKIKTKKEAKALYDELRTEVNTQDRSSFLMDYISNNAERLGYLTKRSE